MSALAAIQDDLRGLKAPLLALAIPIAILIGQSFLTHGWFELAFGPLAYVFWSAIATWIVALVISLRRRQWWALLGAPFALYPVAMSALILVACFQGNCV